ncbi:MAG: thioesterase family protein [Planctomycetota bacterium]
MAPARTELRVRYAETDQMGVVYHSNYVLYFEVGRTEFLRGSGVAYADMEREGVVLAVVDMGARFRRPARYDELLVIETRLVEATGVRVRFEYVVSRLDAAPEGGEETVLCTGFTTLACVNSEGRLSRIQSPYREILEAAVDP